MVISQTTNKELIKLAVVLLALTAILPYISVSSWDKSNLLLFILLYICVGLIRNNEKFIINKNRIWTLIWGGSVFF